MALIGRARLAAVLGVAVTLLVAMIPTASADSGTTEVCRFTDKRLVEISGIANSLAHPGVIWLHNDSGGGPYLYAVSATTCKTLTRVRVLGAGARDFEAIASARGKHGRPLLWLGDIGDNRDSWPSVSILRIPEPSLTATSVRARVYRFTYSDRPHNAEALLVEPNSQHIWVVTKQLAHGGLYVLPKPLSRTRVNIAKRLRTEGGLITDGAVSPDGSRYVLRDYVNATLFDGLPPGRQAGVVPLPLQFQGEAVTFTPDGSALLVASERDDRLLRVALPQGRMSTMDGSPRRPTPWLLRL